MDERRLLARLAQLEEPAVLATIVAARGSTPRKTGAGMLVGERGVIAGTVGGGCGEGEVIGGGGLVDDEIAEAKIGADEDVIDLVIGVIGVIGVSGLNADFSGDIYKSVFSEEAHLVGVGFGVEIAHDDGGGAIAPGIQDSGGLLQALFALIVAVAEVGVDDVERLIAEIDAGADVAAQEQDIFRGQIEQIVTFNGVAAEEGIAPLSVGSGAPDIVHIEAIRKPGEHIEAAPGEPAARNLLEANDLSAILFNDLGEGFRIEAAGGIHSVVYVVAHHADLRGGRIKRGRR